LTTCFSVESTVVDNSFDFVLSDLTVSWINPATNGVFISVNSASNITLADLQFENFQKTTVLSVNNDDVQVDMKRLSGTVRQLIATRNSGTTLFGLDLDDLIITCVSNVW
jgi:hypothetical protein